MVEKLAEEFSRIVRKELAEHLDEILERNRTLFSKSCCATHDFCDANMLMAEAFSEVVGSGIDMGNDDEVKLGNAAWHMAAQNEFFVP